MSTTPTANYAFPKPTVSNDDDAWGTHLNTALDDIDSTIKTVSDVADAAASDAADALAAVGGVAVVAMFESLAATPNVNDTINFEVTTKSSLSRLKRTAFGVTFVNFTSALASGFGVKKTIVVTLENGGAISFTKDSTVALLACDIGGTGAGNATITSQGRHVFEVFCTGGTPDTEIVVKRLGVTTV